MIDFDLMAKYGTTNARLREVLTAQQAKVNYQLSDEERARANADWDRRQEIERWIESTLVDNIQMNLRNYTVYSAVDLMRDSVPINKSTYPLMLYAQGRIDYAGCEKLLNNLNCAGGYVKKKDGKTVGIDLPNFYELTINLPRSIILRRLAAQSNRYTNLWPYYKYEPRGTSQAAKLRADIMSQVADIMADQYDYRHHDIQVLQDTFLYGHCVDFPRCAWERDYQWVKAPVADEFQSKDKPDVQAQIVREGVAWVNPHPSRTFWDNAYPLISLNTDTGCEYVGYWDVHRMRDVQDNGKYWNRDDITLSSNVIGLFQTYAQYFTDYYCYLKVPALDQFGDVAAQNDRLNNIGRYANEFRDTGIIIGNVFRKIIPKDFGIGDYPYPVWVKFMTGGNRTVIYAEFMPSTPACVCSYNESDNRQINISVAHELMSYQDQLTNLWTHLLQTIKTDHLKVMLINTDVLNAEQITAARQQCEAARYDGRPIVLECSLRNLTEMGLDPSRAVQLIETKSVQINVIFQTILQMLSMVERLMAMSPQEQGQPAPREISATETNMIAGTTESVYGYISDAFDAFRAAKKRVVYESYICCGNQQFEVPVKRRYTLKTIQAAGFDVIPDEMEDAIATPDTPTQRTIIGSKTQLQYSYIFTSRDGAERLSNAQGAQALVQLLNVLMANPTIMQSLSKEKVYEIINDIGRMTGADLNMELQEGEANTFGIDQSQQITQVLEDLTGQVEQNSQAIQKLTQMFQQISQPRALPTGGA